METTQLRTQLHGMWASVAPAWAEHADYAFLLESVEGGEHVARYSFLGKGERVLELACGAGGVGIAAAGLVGPAGEVVLSDVAAEMTAIAAARAAIRWRLNPSRSTWWRGRAARGRSGRSPLPPARTGGRCACATRSPGSGRASR